MFKGTITPRAWRRIKYPLSRKRVRKQVRQLWRNLERHNCIFHLRQSPVDNDCLYCYVCHLLYFKDGNENNT